ncbi:AraC family transcriptional regulator [Reichenbachiella carrageenanivorans]|uniref:AraC family transcriptional regulator n=1 Tax=Reichenbachiella carrageenanivorans TaxID=2979869 RepID=A0ABY6CZM1_9BACT|nr:AraC family transcriptional regulator [Reichenbachiella carrageenanivorans]UXX79364.1 AraC family transcriptional regulator [Reichenbachiella carrageenanivorans]
MKRFKRELSPIGDNSCFTIQNHYDAKFDYPVHLHPEYEINVVLHTDGTRIIGDSKEGFRKNDIALVGPNLLHAWRSEKQQGVRVITIQFSKELFEFNLLKKEGMQSISKLLEDSKQGIIFKKRDFIEIKNKILALIDLFDFRGFIAFLELLHTMSKSDYRLALSSTPYLSDFEDSVDNRIEKVCHYISQHFDKKIAIEEAANIINLSPSAFSHYFKRYTYRSFTEYLLDIRLKKACQLLIESDTPIAIIHAKCGFTNASNFNRIFKKAKALTPRAYRQKFGLKVV